MGKSFQKKKKKKIVLINQKEKINLLFTSAGHGIAQMPIPFDSNSGLNLRGGGHLAERAVNKYDLLLKFVGD